MPRQVIASLAFLMTGCVAAHMIVPEALVGRSAALDVVGKSPFATSWHLGEYEVGGAWVGGPSGTDFGFVIAANAADALVVSCTSLPHNPVGGPVISPQLVEPLGLRLGARPGLSCPVGTGSFVAVWKPGLAATLSLGERVLRVEIARGIEGDDLPTPSGLLFLGDAGVVAAFESVGVGRLLVADSTPPADRIAIAAASVAWLRWEDIRSRLDKHPRERSINEDPPVAR